MENRCYISNNCSNLSFYFTENREYNQPIIGALFIHDIEYVRFCLNLEYYLSCKPEFKPPRKDSLWAKQNGSEWYKHVEIIPPYPVMYLGDIEIHFIHEKDENTLLEKYNRRLERFRNEKPKPIFLFSCSDFMNDHTNTEYQNMINAYLTMLTTSFYLTKDSRDLLLYKDIEREGRLRLIERWIGSDNKRNSSYILDIHTVGDRLVDYKELVNLYTSKQSTK